MSSEDVNKYMIERICKNFNDIADSLDKLLETRPKEYWESPFSCLLFELVVLCRIPLTTFKEVSDE